MNAPAPALAVLPADPDRRRFIGGSDAAAIMGLGAYGRTPLTTYFAKTSDTHEALDPERKRFFERRKRFEPLIVEMLREEFDAEIVCVNQRYIDVEHDFLAAEIDFEWRDPADGTIQNGEIKTVSPFAFGEKHGWGDVGSDEIPIHYAAQVMHGLGVTGRRTCIVAALAGFDKMVFYKLLRDEETIAEMRARCINFWTEHVLKFVPPDPISLEDCLRLSTRIRGRPIEADDELLANLQALKNIRASMKAMGEESDEVTFKIGATVLKAWGLTWTDGDIISPAKDAAIILRGGQQIASWNLQETTRLQPQLLREAMPEVFAQFSKTTKSRVLRLKKEK